MREGARRPSGRRPSPVGHVDLVVLAGATSIARTGFTSDCGSPVIRPPISSLSWSLLRVLGPSRFRAPVPSRAWASGHQRPRASVSRVSSYRSGLPACRQNRAAPARDRELEANTAMRLAYAHDGEAMMLSSGQAVAVVTVPPDTKLALEATELIRIAPATLVYNHHSRRVFWLGSLQGVNRPPFEPGNCCHRGAFHDLGRTRIFRGSGRRFEVSSADEPSTSCGPRRARGQHPPPV